MDHLEPAFKDLRFSLKPDSVRLYRTTKREYSVATRGPIRRILFYVPRWILENPSGANQDAVFSLPRGFPRGTTLFIFSDKGLDAPDLAFDDIMKDDWQRQLDIQAFFVPWRYVQGLGEATTSQEREYDLQRMLKLDDAALDEQAMRKYLGRLRDLLVERFKSDELERVLYDAGIDYENLRGEGKAAKAQALVEYLENRREQALAEFLKAAKKHRTDIDWDNI
jgi:hypothetical protein